MESCKIPLRNNHKEKKMGESYFSLLPNALYFEAYNGNPELENEIEASLWTRGYKSRLPRSPLK